MTAISGSLNLFQRLEVVPFSKTLKVTAESGETSVITTEVDTPENFIESHISCFVPLEFFCLNHKYNIKINRHIQNNYICAMTSKIENLEKIVKEKEQLEKEQALLEAQQAANALKVASNVQGEMQRIRERSNTLSKIKDLKERIEELKKKIGPVNEEIKKLKSKIKIIEGKQGIAELYRKIKNRCHTKADKRKRKKRHRNQAKYKWEFPTCAIF